MHIGTNDTGSNKINNTHNPACVQCQINPTPRKIMIHIVYITT